MMHCNGHGTGRRCSWIYLLYVPNQCMITQGERSTFFFSFIYLYMYMHQNMIRAATQFQHQIIYHFLSKGSQILTLLIPVSIFCYTLSQRIVKSTQTKVISSRVAETPSHFGSRITSPTPTRLKTAFPAGLSLSNKTR